MKSISLSAMMLLLVIVPWTMAGQVYERLDEKGVKHFTNEPPPPGATVVGQDKEIPFDALKDSQRKKSDKQFLQQKQQEQMGKTNAPSPADTPPATGDQDDVTVRTEEDSNTYHQRQVQKEQRIKQEIREHGGRPEANPLPANRSEVKPAQLRQHRAD